jgi:hypothetical protein
MLAHERLLLDRLPEMILVEFANYQALFTTAILTLDIPVKTGDLVQIGLASHGKTLKATSLVTLQHRTITVGTRMRLRLSFQYLMRDRKTVIHRNKQMILLR